MLRNFLSHNKPQMSNSSLLSTGTIRYSIIQAGLGEGFFDEFETETVYSDEEQYGYDIAVWIGGRLYEPVYKYEWWSRTNSFKRIRLWWSCLCTILEWLCLYQKTLYQEEDVASEWFPWIRTILRSSSLMKMNQDEQISCGATLVPVEGV